jgi:two-component system, OmpR family, phosphate regulon sensor histidine kinase PhoR
MKSKSIRIIIILAVIALVGVVTNHFFWINKEIKIQDNLLKIEQKNIQIEKSQFNNQVTLALVNVRDELLSLNIEASGLYLEPVKQINPNYFVVSFYDTLNPELLKNLLVEQFKEYNIKEVFEYGIYDCFTDSIIFDRYVNLSSRKELNNMSGTELEKWNHDGHYFGIYFPERKNTSFSRKENISKSFYISSIVIVFITLIFAYAIVVILKQKRLSEVKTDFINNMTHELKTPISTIGLSSEVLLNKDIHKDPERIHRYAQIIKDENSRLESQVERVLQLAMLDKGEINLKKETINIEQLIKESVEVFRISTEQNGGTITTSFDMKENNLLADKVHVTNIIHNLLDNASKYSPDSPTIDVKAFTLNNGISVSITDNGKGINKEQQKLIFDKFYRVPTGSVHDVKGFGLGLYYVKQIINQHGGKISVESEINKGSKFTFWLPA